MGITGRGRREGAGRELLLQGSVLGNGRGFVFSLDLAVAFIAMLLMLSIVLMHAGSAGARERERLHNFEAMEKLVFLADSLVKNNDQEAVLGSARFDEEKRRVESNVLDKALLLKAGEIEGRGIEVAGVWFREVDGEEERLFEGKGGEDCISVERFVLIDGRKGIVGVSACS